jgi:hypothetical protein
MAGDYWDETEYNDPEEVSGPDDVTLPITAHHMQAQAELDLLLRAGSLTEEDAELVLKRWRARKQLGGGDRVRAAVAELERHGVVDEAEAEDLLDREIET